MNEIIKRFTEFLELFPLYTGIKWCLSMVLPKKGICYYSRRRRYKKDSADLNKSGGSSSEGRRKRRTKRRGRSTRHEVEGEEVVKRVEDLPSHASLEGSSSESAVEDPAEDKAMTTEVHSIRWSPGRSQPEDASSSRRPDGASSLKSDDNSSYVTADDVSSRNSQESYNLTYFS